MAVQHVGVPVQLPLCRAVFTRLPCCSRPARPARSKAEAEGPAPAQLRVYQQRLVQAARGGANLIFVAPTNSGKTAVAKEHSAAVLGSNPQARGVFITPTVALATQQAGEEG